MRTSPDERSRHCNRASFRSEARAVGTLSVLRQGIFQMSIKDLIEHLASEARPVQRHAFRTIMGPSLVIGALCGLVVMVMTIGMRPDLEEADTIAQLIVRGGLGLGSVIAGLAEADSHGRSDTPRHSRSGATLSSHIELVRPLPWSKRWSLALDGSLACNPFVCLTRRWRPIRGADAPQRLRRGARIDGGRCRGVPLCVRL